MTRYFEVLADAGADADAQQQEEARAELVAALEELGVDEVRLRELPAAAGSKSGGVGAAEILVAVAPALIAAVVAAFESWTGWASARQVRVRIGENEFEAGRLTDAERRRLIDHFIAQTAAQTSTAAGEPHDGGA
ncbi:hypothetical protein ACFVFI_27805 [Streptomyces sp. NPDC057705]|uniref:hypothetical protein n=1 Tax=Streptomyces sp. NPDC057705 TaxID=3346222 RepID=UPI00367A0673